MSSSSWKRNTAMFSLGLRGYHALRPVGRSEDPQVEALVRDGVTVLPGVLSPELCARLRKEIDANLPLATRFGADSRLFGAEFVSAAVRDEVSDHPALKGVGDRYLGVPQRLETTLAARIVADGSAEGSGGGWHRDSFLPQYKAIVYLCDVDETNGPFQYVRGSNRMQDKLDDHRSRAAGRRGSPRYGPDEIDAYAARVVTVFGRAGDAILCDTSGIHRGSPLRSGERYAVTNYYAVPPIWPWRARRGSTVRKYVDSTRNASPPNA